MEKVFICAERNGSFSEEILSNSAVEAAEEFGLKHKVEEVSVLQFGEKEIENFKVKG